MKSAFGGMPDKRVPQSKKYSHINSNIDTGASAKKQNVVSTAQAARRRDEIFKRVKPATLVRMLQEREVNESVYAMGSGGGGSERGDTIGNDLASISSVMASKAPAHSVAVHSVASVHSVAGSVLSVIDSDTTINDLRDFVLLDLREPQDFDQCHLPMALNYPAQKINRDQFSPELYSCKRDNSKLLIVYHADDALTAGVATLLVQKGWDNVHALTGGFEEMAQSYPEALEGDVPERPHTGTSQSVGRGPGLRA